MNFIIGLIVSLMLLVGFPTLPSNAVLMHQEVQGRCSNGAVLIVYYYDLNQNQDDGAERVEVRMIGNSILYVLIFSPEQGGLLVGVYANTPSGVKRFNSYEELKETYSSDPCKIADVLLQSTI